MLLQSSTDRVKIYVVDDDAGMRNSIAMVLRVAGYTAESFDSAESFLESYNPKLPGCLVLDMHMPGLGGVQLIELLRDRNWHIPVVVVTGTGTVRLAVRTMQLGAVDFLEKPVAHSLLLEKVRGAIRLELEHRAQDVELSSARTRLATLSPRESELLEMITSGLSNKQVAIKLGLSIKTVDNHRANIMRKMGAGNAAELVRLRMQAA
jgi:FixJ family two-component response regulator